MKLPILHSIPILILTWLPSLAEAAEPALIASLGDSITAATFADTSLQHANYSATPAEIDLIVQEYKSKALMENKRTLSWFSGQSIQSHAALLFKQFPEDRIIVNNLAVPGSKAKDLISQATELVDSVRENNFSEVKYITVFIGSNDACSSETSQGTPNDRFEEEVYAGLKKIAELPQPSIRVLVVSLPRIADLGSEEVKSKRTMGFFTCESFRRRLNLCQSMVTWTTEEEHQEKLAVIAGKNASLRKVVAQAQKDFKKLNLHFTSRPFDISLQMDWLAADCFHPNKIGQQLFSKHLWEEQPWFK